MERTPSPSRRVRTPPAPMHGPKHDSYEPFSPRRSSRVAAQTHIHLEQTRISPARQRTIRDVTPTSSRRKIPPMDSTHTLSPPSSPAKILSPRPARRSHLIADVLDSDSDRAAPTPAARRFFSAIAPEESLLTPAKTPRKRPIKTEESLRSTARVLFATNRPATVEEAMPTPTPRKSRKTNAYSLESFAEQMEEPEAKIEIYTDSKERVPTRDDEDDNPFVTKKGKGKAKAAPPKPRKITAETKALFDAAARGEGLVFSLKGKKMLRRYHDGPPHDASEGELQAYEEKILSESSTYGRITRSSIKPRKLFQEEISHMKRDNPEDEEEALTDIDTPVATPIATPSRRAEKVAAPSVASSTPSSTQEATPPPTRRLTKQMSFNDWSRVKSSSRSDSASRASKKRSGPALESGTDKRTRLEHSSSTLSMEGT